MLLASPCPPGPDLFSDVQDHLKPPELCCLEDKGQSPRGVVTVEATSGIAWGESAALCQPCGSAGLRDTPSGSLLGRGQPLFPVRGSLHGALCLTRLYQVAEFSAGSVFSSPTLKDVETLK